MTADDDRLTPVRLTLYARDARLAIDHLRFLADATPAHDAATAAAHLSARYVAHMIEQALQESVVSR